MQSLGKSLQRAKETLRRGQREKYRVLLEADRNASNTILYEERQQQRKGEQLKSIWETNNLEEFLLIADTREKGYDAARNICVVVNGTSHVLKNDKVLPLTDDRVDWLKLSELLTIPRRPKWNYDMLTEEVQALETSAFLEWRRRLSKVEEEHKVVMTPYEKNLDVWRQLWRVVERADIVLMILDARNPLVFRCADFEAYVRTLRNQAGKAKEIIFLLNKSDLLTDNQRIAWAAYFAGRGEQFFFFSATRAPMDSSEKNKNEEDNTKPPGCREEDNSEEEEVGITDENGVSKVLRHRKEKRRHNKKSLRAPVEVANPYELIARHHERKASRKQHQQQRPTQPPTAEEKARDLRILQLNALHSWDVLDPVQLLDCLATWRTVCGIENAETPLMVGLVGYPNVGKSSTINAILGCKRVVVSATPGKTKHFQTLVIPNERRVALCDCPGLVFPSFSSTREKMVCDGILPTDTVTDAVSAVAVLCRRIPRLVLENYFKVSLLPEDDVDDSHSFAERFLNAVARRRGYLGAHDRPNKSRAARDVLKLHVDGTLLYVEPPPNYTAPAEKVMEEALRNLVVDSKNDVSEKNFARDGCGEGFELEADEWEDIVSLCDEDCDTDAWEFLDSATSACAFSNSGSVHSGENRGACDRNGNLDGSGKVMLLTFYERPKGARGTLTSQEEFNAESNFKRIKEAMCAVAGRRKKRTNHQLLPVTDTFVNKDGEVELIIDDDDGVVELTAGLSLTGGEGKTQGQQQGQGEFAEKQWRSKRQMRRELKRAGMGPVNPTARKLGVHGY